MGFATHSAKTVGLRCAGRECVAQHFFLTDSGQVEFQKKSRGGDNGP
jgi:hypothetical protein